MHRAIWAQLSSYKMIYQSKCLCSLNFFKNLTGLGLRVIVICDIFTIVLHELRPDSL